MKQVTKKVKKNYTQEEIKAFIQKLKVLASVNRAKQPTTEGK